MSQLDVADNSVTADTVRASVYVPPLQRTEGQPPPIAALGGLSYSKQSIIQRLGSHRSNRVQRSNFLRAPRSPIKLLPSKIRLDGSGTGIALAMETSSIPVSSEMGFATPSK